MRASKTTTGAETPSANDHDVTVSETREYTRRLETLDKSRGQLRLITRFWTADHRGVSRLLNIRDRG